MESVELDNEEHIVGHMIVWRELSASDSHC